MAELALRFAGPNGLEAFEGTVRERNPSFFPQTLTELEAKALLTPGALGEELYPDSPALKSCDIFTGNHLVRLIDMLNRSGRHPVDVIGQQLSSGASARFCNLERLLPNLGHLGHAVETIFGGATTINAYLTPAGRKGFPVHFDNTDVFILQLLGSKRWTLFDSYSNRKELPMRDTPWDPERYRPNAEGCSYTLKAGDLIYLPRGSMHAVESLDDISFHLTISLDPLTVHDAMRRELERWAGETLEARRRLVRDPGEATRDLRRLAGDFERWLGQQKVQPDEPIPSSTRDGAGRFDDLVEHLRAAGKRE